MIIFEFGGALPFTKRLACGEKNRVQGRNCDAAKNVRFLAAKEDKGKDAGSVWQLVYGKTQHKNNMTTINMGLLGGHCFYIKEMDVLCKRWMYIASDGCRQIFTRNENLIRHLKDERCTGGKTKIICSGGKFKHILNLPEKVFYGGSTKFSYTACQWTEAQAIETANTFIIKCVAMAENAW